MAPKDTQPAINIPDWMFKICLTILGCIIAFTLNKKTADDEKVNDKLDKILTIQEELKSDNKLFSRDVKQGAERLNEFGNRLNEYSERLRELEIKEAQRAKK